MAILTTLPNELQDTDVVLGRGGLANNHPGNKLFRQIVSENKQFYQQSLNSTHKQLLISSIVMAIQKHGGRFVKKEGQNWKEIPDCDAHSKTAQALRELDQTTSPSNRKKQKQPERTDSYPLSPQKVQPIPWNIVSPEKMDVNDEDIFTEFLLDHLPTENEENELIMRDLNPLEGDEIAFADKREYEELCLGLVHVLS